MPVYISKRYAPLLTKYDMQMLFSWLTDAYGSIAKAAKVTKVQRKTIYDWETNTEDVRLETKIKVLEQSMKLDENRTLEFLIRKTDNDLKEVLQHHLRCLFENAMKTDSKEDFLEHASLFHDIQGNHRGAVFDNPREDINEMNQALTAKAKEFQVDIAEPSIRLIPPETLAEKIIAFLEVLKTKKYTIEEMKKLFDLPSELIGNVCKALNYLDPGKAIFIDSDEETVSKVGLDMGEVAIHHLMKPDFESMDPNISLNSRRVTRKERVR